MTNEARKLKDAFEKEVRKASEAIDAVMAAPPAEHRQRQTSGERGAVAEIARDIVAAATTMRTRIELAMRGRDVRGVRS